MATKYLLNLSGSLRYNNESHDKYISATDGAEYGFKVECENQAVIIASTSAVGEAVASAASSPDCRIQDVKCTPVISYEGFAKSSLGVSDEEVVKKGPTPAFSPDKETYWVQVDVGYKGHTLEELRQAWHDEAVAALTLVHGGEVPFMLYKSVFMRQVHLFIQMEGAALDRLNLLLPLFKALGDQVQTTVKRVKLFHDPIKGYINPQESL